MRQIRVVYLLVLVFGEFAILAILTHCTLAQGVGNGQLIGLDGAVSIRLQGEAGFKSATLLDPLLPGFTLRTGEAGKAKLFFPPDTVLTLDQQTTIELVTNASSPLASEKFMVKLLTGNLHFIVGKASARSGARLQLQSPLFLIEPADVEGILASQAQDRLICLSGGSGLSVTKSSSQQHFQLSPGQMATCATNGQAEITVLKSYQLEQFSASPAATTLPPPATVLQPPAPAHTPITLADRVKQPWPVFPPVIQSPNLWIKEIYGGRQVRPNPRP